MRQNTDLVSEFSTGYGHKCLDDGYDGAFEALFLLHIKMGGTLIAPLWHPSWFFSPNLQIPVVGLQLYLYLCEEVADPIDFIKK